MGGWSRRLRALFRSEAPAGQYTTLQLDTEAIARGDFKQHLRGGEDFWESRGRFQLRLLTTIGMTPISRLLDIGCGPLRAGPYFIRYLNAANYCGIDYNESFIAACRTIIAANDLAQKQPVLTVLRDFDFARLNRKFDFAIAFSVLNHAGKRQRGLFLEHPPWLEDVDLKDFGLSIYDRVNPDGFDLERTASSTRVFPIFVLGN